MRYVEARFDEYNREEAYRSYVTHSLQLIPQNQYIIPTFEEILNPKSADTRTGDEIVSDVMKSAGLKFG